jgi:hypothetical protein
MIAYKPRIYIFSHPRQHQNGNACNASLAAKSMFQPYPDSLGTSAVILDELKSVSAKVYVINSGSDGLVRICHFDFSDSASEISTQKEFLAASELGNRVSSIRIS